MQSLQRIAIWIDEQIENFALLSLLSMVLIVVLQVITRRIFNFVFFWSEEVTILLLGTFTYIGIAIGFREHLHLEMDMIANLLPKKALWCLDKLIQFSTFSFGVYLLYFGIDFCIDMSSSTLPATKISNMWTYAVLPLAGSMICIYSLLQLFGFDTARYEKTEEEMD